MRVSDAFRWQLVLKGHYCWFHGVIASRHYLAEDCFIGARTCVALDSIN